MPNPVVHFEVTGSNAPALQQFYRDAFQWPIDANNPMQYGEVDDGGQGIGGGIGGDKPGVTFYIQVADLATALDQVKRLGGTVVQPITVIPNMVTFAKVADPEGNVVGMIQAQ